MSEVILECKNIKKSYKKKDHLHIAAKDTSFKLYEGESLGIVGESGSGKSTLARMIMNLEKVDSGEIYFRGKDITNIKGRKLKEVYKDMQMVFQDARGSFNPKMTIGESIYEYVCNLCSVSYKERKNKVYDLLEDVGLSKEYANRYPYELSGGQCQRAAIARAVAAHPKLLICDEATSALDVSVQAQVMKLLEDMREKLNISYVFISHDIALVSSFCDKIIVMKDGEIVEMGNTLDVINNPSEKYTEILINSILTL